MLRTLALYIRQRFDLPRFAPLTAFLLFYAAGLTLDVVEFTVAFLYMLLLLFWFRMFDDLASSEVDAGKDDRIYTSAEEHRQLRQLFLPLGVLTGTIAFAWSMEAGVMTSGFLLLNIAAYRSLFGRWRWRQFLPLVKYPVLALLALMLSSGSRITSEEALRCSALFPAFILFEWLDDRSFRLQSFMAALLVAVMHLLMIPSTQGGEWMIVAAGCVVMIPAVVIAHRRAFRWMAYVVLAWMLVVSMMMMES